MIHLLVAVIPHLSQNWILFRDRCRQIGLRSNHDPEFLVIDFAISILVHSLDHLVNLLVGHSLIWHVGQDELELLSCDAT